MIKLDKLLCIIAGLLPLAVITLLAAIDPNFILFSDYLSKLGTGQYAIVFNCSLVVAAFFSAPFLYRIGKGPGYAFIAAAFALAGVGVFPATSWLHVYFAGAFFLLMFASILTIGLKIWGRGGHLSVAVGIFGFTGLVFLNPFIETVLVYVIGIWVVGAAVVYKKIKSKGFK